MAIEFFIFAFFVLLVNICVARYSQTLWPALALLSIFRFNLFICCFVIYFCVRLVKASVNNLHYPIK